MGEQKSKRNADTKRMEKNMQADLSKKGRTISRVFPERTHVAGGIVCGFPLALYESLNQLLRYSIP